MEIEASNRNAWLARPPVTLHSQRPTPVSLHHPWLGPTSAPADESAPRVGPRSRFRGPGEVALPATALLRGPLPSVHWRKASVLYPLTYEANRAETSRGVPGGPPCCRPGGRPATGRTPTGHPLGSNRRTASSVARSALARYSRGLWSG